MIKSIECYHGTTYDNLRKILAEHKMIPSRGTRHWLGDGVYFFKDDFYAYKWIVQECHDKYGNSYPDKINEYGILQVFLKVRQNRIFDLRNLEHKRIYDFTYKRILEEFNKKNDIPDQLTDGVVINYMFNILKFQRKYDLIIANYFFKKKKSKGLPVQLQFIEQIQICVKNTRIIRKMKEYR